MATAQSPHSASEPSNYSATQSNGTSRKRKRSAHLSGATTQEYGFMRDTGEHDSARFVGSSSGIHFIRNVHMRLARRSANRSQNGKGTGPSVTEGRLGELVPGEDDQLRRRANQKDGSSTRLWKDSEITEDIVTDSSPTFEQLVGWSKSYFESWHPILPFLHGPDVLRIFEDIGTLGMESLHPLDSAIVRAVLSISLADSRQGLPLGEPIPSKLLFQTVEEAVACSQFALCQPASMRSTQAALSTQLFLISILCLNAASRLGGLLVRMAFHLGLHRCPTRYPFFTAEEASRRRRVFWCLYCCERFLSQSLGLPLDIRDDDVDVCYPGEELHGITSPGDGNDKRLQLLTFMAKHAKIRGLILELRNKSIPARHDTADRAMAVQTELAKWANEIQDTIDETEMMDAIEESSSSGISSSHCLVLLLSKYESTICLNRPMMASDPTSPMWSSAMQACISAAKSICIATKRYCNRHRLLSDPSGRTLAAPMLWPAFIWATWISAFVLAHAAFEQHMPLESALRHIESSRDALRHMAARDTSWPEYCLSAIEELLSAVKEIHPTQGSQTQNTVSNDASSRAQSAARASVRNTRSRAHEEGSTTNSAPSHDVGEPAWADNTSAPPVVLSSAGLGRRTSEQPPISEDFAQQRAADWSRAITLFTGHPRNQNYPPSQAGASDLYQPVWVNPMAASAFENGQPTPSGPGAGQDLPPSGFAPEGQESMAWYDQLFGSSFSAIDNPFLAAAQFDPSIDPTWSYLT